MSIDDFDDLEKFCASRVGRVLGNKYTLDALVGIGGMAAVYKATHRNGSKSAIKMLHPEYAATQEIKDRFLNEAYIANKVHHPGAVHVFDDDVDEENSLYIVMELLEGKDLDDFMAEAGGILPVEITLRMMDDLLSVLEAAHAENIIHRDIKPENIFITNQGQLKLLDFGIARLKDAAGGNMTKTGMLLGTPAFMPPEQALGRHSQLDGRADLWAVGAVMFNMISGRRVHEGKTANELLISAATEPARSLARVAPNAPVELIKIVDKVLQFEPANRFANAAEMRKAMAPLMVQQSPAPPAPQGTTAAAAPSQQAAGTQMQGQKAGALNLPPAPSATRAPAASAGQAAPAPRAAPQPPQAAVPRPKASPGRQQAPPGALNLPPPPSPTRAAGSAQAAPGSQTAPQPQAAPDAEQASPYAATQYMGDSPLGQPAPGASPQAPPAKSPDKAEWKKKPKRPGLSSSLVNADLELEKEEVESLRELFKLMEKVLVSKKQYEAEHPETLRRIQEMENFLLDAMDRHEYGLMWKISPYAFKTTDEILWEPEAPWDLVPYQLFADGIRIMAVRPGVDTNEFRKFFKIITLDRAREMSPEDDFVTLLWETDFENVEFEAIDSFAEGDQEQRANFEKAKQNIVKMAEMETPDDLEDCWNDARQGLAGGSGDLGQKTKTIMGTLSSGESTDLEAAVQASAFGEAANREKKPDQFSRLLRSDENTLRVIAAQIERGSGRMGDRFAVAAGEAYMAYEKKGRGEVVTRSLRMAVDGLVDEQPLAAVEMVRLLCEAIDVPGNPEEAEHYRAKIAGTLISKELMQKLFESATQQKDTEKSVEGSEEDFARGLEIILGFIDATYVPLVAEALRSTEPGPVFEQLVAYIKKYAEGNEEFLGNLIPTADLKLALDLIHILKEIGTEAAMNAMIYATRSEHPVVRIEALGNLEGESSQRVTEELKNLLQDKNVKIRLAALEAIEKHNVYVAGPYLARRLVSTEFRQVSIAEKRQAFSTVAALSPGRTQIICLDILNDTHLISVEGFEEIRACAAEALGRIGKGPQVVKTLEKMSKSRWKNSEKVREASSRALALLEERKSQKSTKKQEAAAEG